MYIAQAGDILLYPNPPTWDTRLIIDGEHMEDPGEDKWFYHVAIALDANRKIEAQGKTVAVDSIDYGHFEAYRPPIPYTNVQQGLYAAEAFLGQPYDWLAIINDGLSYLTRGQLHLPEKWVESAERKRKICSSLVATYFNETQWGPEFALAVSPEDIYKAVKQWPVSGQSVG